jgi:iron complex outermembrane recepter protein
MKRYGRGMDGVCLGLALLVQSVAPHAQEVSAGGLEEVIVTAQKRESVEQKTAIAMSVFDSEALERNGVASVADLSAIAPSVSFATSNATHIITVRGISSRDTTEIGDPAVSLSIDGFNLQRAVGLNATLFDLERVEVLRGPQGTLVGRNATGGAVNIITAKPVDDFTASAGVETGSYGTINTQGMVNVPISETLRIRASAQTREHEGYRNNAPARDGDDERSKAARLHVLWDPTDQLSILLTAELGDLKGAGPVVQAVPQRFTAPGVVDLSRPDIPADGETFAVPPGSFIDAETINYRANVNYDFGPATLTYVGGWRELDFKRVGTLGGQYGTVRQNFTFNQAEELESWNHELRLTSNGDSRLKWQVGGYYFIEKNDVYTLFQDYPGSASLSGASINLQTYSYPDIEAKASAFFGQASYELIDGVTFEAGARASKDEKHRVGFNRVTNTANYVATGCTQATCVFVTTPQNSSMESDETTYHAALNWQATSRNLLYLKYDTGYKAGGFTDIAPYDPETIGGFELGSKNRFLDNRLQLNLAAFHYDYEDQQVSQAATTAAGAIGTRIVNAGETRIRGIEVEAVAALTDSDRVNLYTGYTEAEFQDFRAAVSGQLASIAYAEGACTPVSSASATPCNWQLAGRTLPQAPEVSVNFGYEHEWPLFGGSLLTRVQTHYESDSNFTIYNFAADSQPSYTRSDVIVSYSPAGRAWTLTGYVRNIEDELILASAQDPSTQTYASYRYQYQPPRTYGVRFVYEW